MLPFHQSGKEPGGQATDPGEESRLDEAIERADQLLFTSLKTEERRRSRRRIVFISLGALLLGGLVMSAILCFALVGWGPVRSTVAPNNEQSVLPDATAGAQQSQAAQSARSTAVASNSEEAARLAAVGWSLWQRQIYNAAAGRFEEAVKLDPKNVNAWNGLGWASFNGGNYEPAEKAFRKVIALEPKHPAALNGLGQLALAQRNYAKAEEYLLKAAQAPAAWYGLTKVYLLTGRYDKAAKWGEKIVRSGQADPELAKLLDAAKKKNLPPDLRRLIEPDPHTTTVARGWQLMNQGRHEEAKAVFQSVLAKDPRAAAALNGMGWCLVGTGETSEAKPYFEQAIAVDPQAAGALNGLARVLVAQGDNEGAITIWQKMVEKIPGPHAGTVGLANAYFEKKEYRKAVPLLEELAKAYPDNQDVKRKLAVARTGGR